MKKIKTLLEMLIAVIESRGFENTISIISLLAGFITMITATHIFWEDIQRPSGIGMMFVLIAIISGVTIVLRCVILIVSMFVGIILQGLLLGLKRL